MTKSDNISGRDPEGWNVELPGGRTPVPSNPTLRDSEIFPGEKSVKSAEGGHFESRTGSAGSGRQ